MTMRDALLTILRTFVSSCVAIVCLLLSTALILSLGASDAVVVGAVAGGFLLGVGLGLWVTRRMSGLQFPAMGLLALTGAAAAFVVDVPFFGNVQQLRAGEPIVTGLTVAGYAAPGWHIDATRTRDERLSGGRGNKSYGTRRVAPLVPEGWTSDRPVHIWIAGEIRNSGRVLPSHPKFWDEGGGEFVRVAGNSRSGAQLQAGRAAAAHGLSTSEEPVIVTRVPSVRGAIRQQAWALLSAARFPLGAWALMLAIAAGLAVWRNRQAAGAH